MSKKISCDKMNKWLDRVQKKSLFYKLYTENRQFCVFHIFQTFLILNAFFSFINFKTTFVFLIFT